MIVITSHFHIFTISAPGICLVFTLAFWFLLSLGPKIRYLDIYIVPFHSVQLCDWIFSNMYTESFFVCCWILKAETSFTCELDFIEQVASGIKYLIRSPTFGFFVQISVEYKYHILWRSLQLIGGWTPGCDCVGECVTKSDTYLLPFQAL